MKTLNKSLAFLAITMMLLSLIPFLPAYAQAFEIYFTPAANNFDTSTTDPCYHWDITLWAKDIPDPGAWAWQARLNIVPAGDWINITNAYLELADPAYIFTGMSSVAPSPAFSDSNIDGCYDSVLVGDSILVGTPVAGAGPFKLATITLHLVKAPGKYESFYADLSINNVDTFVLNEQLAEIGGLVKTGGYVRYDWSPPTTIPTVAVVPDYIEFDAGTNWTDHVFNVEVRIQNLEVGWALHNASFNLNYDPLVLAVQGVVIDPAWAGPNVVGVVPGMISVFVQGHPAPAGDVLVATLSFKILYKNSVPPAPVGTFITTALTFTDIILWNTVGTIDYYIRNGEYDIYAYSLVEYPWLEVDPSDLVLNPEGELVICEQYGITFDVDILIKRADPRLKLIGINFRLEYDIDLLEIVAVTPGPALDPFAPYGTFDIVVEKEPPNPFKPVWHAILGTVILPNATGHWNPPFPDIDLDGAVLWTITFKPLQQSWVDPIITDLHINPMWPGTPSEYGTDPDGNTVPFEETQFVHGTVTILPIAPRGRLIDVWFVNPPNGGQGIGTPADLVLPQTEITLTAKVTYNWWHVQYKKVTFEIRDNTGTLWAILQDDTGEDGHAYAIFRMPWPCEGAEDLLGKWTVTVSVTLADVVITDTVTFDYDYLIRIWKVSTDKLEYRHCEDVVITVEYGTHLMAEADVILAVTITDELNVPIAVILVEMTIGGAEFCQYKNYTTTVTLHVDKFAYAGLATVHASFLTDLPTQGGEACAQEVATTFWILPC